MPADRSLAPPHPPRAANFVTLGLTVLLLAWTGPGCRLVKTAVDVPAQTVRAVTPGKKGQPAVDPVEVQQKVLRFADEFSTRMTLGVEKLQRGTSALDRGEVLKWKIAFGAETCSIASGPNAVANLLDMTVFVTATRATVEDYWQPEVFGNSALTLLESCRISETNVWQLAGTVLQPPQLSELRQAIEAWHQENPRPENALVARALGFTSRVAPAGKSAAAIPDSVFHLLNVDPLSGLDPAVREIAQTRMFAERALFVTQKMPILLRWQTELLTLNAVEMPTVQQLVSNSTQIAASVERFAGVAEKLPAQVSAERAEILHALEAQEKQLTPLVNEVRQTLTAGAQMSTSLNTTLTTFDALMKRFGVGEPSTNAPAATNAPPFNILDYAQAAGQFEKMAKQLTELLRAANETSDSNNLARISTQLAPVVQQAQTGGKEVVDYAFWKGLLLVGLALAAALLYRFLNARMTAKSNRP